MLTGAILWYIYSGVAFLSSGFASATNYNHEATFKK